jgi:hypothetical protein
MNNKTKPVNGWYIERIENDPGGRDSFWLWIRVTNGRTHFIANNEDAAKWLHGVLAQPLPTHAHERHTMITATATLALLAAYRSTPSASTPFGGALVQEVASLLDTIDEASACDFAFDYALRIAHAALSLALNTQPK